MAERSKNKKRVGLFEVLQGSVLLDDSVIRRLPLVVLITLLGLLMISNRFKGEKTLRQIEVLQDSVKELRSESATVEAEVMNRGRYSYVINECERRGLQLKQADEPPIKIMVKK